MIPLLALVLSPLQLLARRLLSTSLLIYVAAIVQAALSLAFYAIDGEAPLILRQAFSATIGLAASFAVAGWTVAAVAGRRHINEGRAE